MLVGVKPSQFALVDVLLYYLAERSLGLLVLYPVGVKVDADVYVGIAG